jgi:hypothetical protein
MVNIFGIQNKENVLLNLIACIIEIYWKQLGIYENRKKVKTWGKNTVALFRYIRDVGLSHGLWPWK